ncbi:unnamed protein product [Linum trigynum]|uniref:Endonuclease/exonuclease/phosphatase domain-containing protein n=1 Tax=Linum trigynum TaxID=586398 RepID=A0AAV2DWK1_9ROSI
MAAFSECLTEVGLQDLGFSGYPYTWENCRRNGGYIEESLDRFVANHEWRACWRNGQVLHFDATRSDHRPVACDTLGEEDEETRWGWSFHFEAQWTKHPECENMIATAWGSATGNALMKCTQVKDSLDGWSRAAFPNFRRQKARIRRALNALERRERTPEVLDQRAKLQLEMDELESDEELYWQ